MAVSLTDEGPQSGHVPGFTTLLASDGQIACESMYLSFEGIIPAGSVNLEGSTSRIIINVIYLTTTH